MAPRPHLKVRPRLAINAEKRLVVRLLCFLARLVPACDLEESQPVLS